MEYYNANKIVELEDIVKRFKNLYYNSEDNIWDWRVPKAKETYEKLINCLNDNPTVEKIDKIFGNNSWTRQTCNECDKDSLIGFKLFWEDDEKLYSHFICIDCVKNMAFL